MEDKIEIGEYGRTNYGKIIKFAWILHSNGKRVESKVILINKDTLSNDFYYFSIGESIVKHSKIISEVVNVGDYVNGKLIHKIDKGPNYCYLYYGNCKTFVDYQIKTILTKESYMANCYKVGGEDE